jgi:flagellar motor switch protein FliN
MANHTDSSAFELADSSEDAVVETGTPGEKTKKALSNEAAHYTKNDYSKIGQILDVPLKVSVEIGHTKMLAHEVLDFAAGKIIELDKLAGEALEILLNDKLIALGEVVVVNEKYGVRLTDVISSLNPTQHD